MSCLFGIWFLLHFFILSAGYGFCRNINQEMTPICPWLSLIAIKLRLILSRKHNVWIILFEYILSVGKFFTLYSERYVEAHLFGYCKSYNPGQNYWLHQTNSAHWSPYLSNVYVLLFNFPPRPQINVGFCLTCLNMFQVTMQHWFGGGERGRNCLFYRRSHSKMSNICKWSPMYWPGL